MSDLLALAERCEAATGADGELDAAIDAATPEGRWAPHCEVAPSPTRGRVQWRNRGVNNPWHEQDSKHFTASLDAAMTLVPDNMGWTHWSPIGKRPTVAIQTNAGWGTYYGGHTVALALCAAALRARAAQRIAARSDETPQAVQPVGQEPDGEADAPSPDPRMAHDKPL